MNKPIVPKLRFPGFRDEWQVKMLGDLLKVGSGRDYKHLGKGSIPVYGTGGLMLYVDDYLYDGKSICIGRKGTIDKPQLLNGKFWTVDTLFYTHDYKNSVPEFLYLIFQRINWQQWNEASGVPSLSKTTVEKIKVSTPSEDEQEKIAAFLGNVDDKITALLAKKEMLGKYKMGIVQKIFSRQIRFNGENDKIYPDWKENRLGNIFTERLERGGKTDDMLSVTINRGITRFSDSARKDNSSKDKSNYKQVIKGDIAYNSMRMWQGASGVSPFSGIVSPAYTVLSPKEGQNSKFWAYYFKLRRVINIFQRNSQGLTSDTWNLKFDALSKIKLNAPSFEEQEKIAEFLISIDEIIEAEERKLEQARLLKKALLQQMFVYPREERNS